MGTVITVLTVDAALQHVCAELRERAIGATSLLPSVTLTPDGAILLAMLIDDPQADDHADPDSGWQEGRRRIRLGGTNDK